MKSFEIFTSSFFKKRNLFSNSNAHIDANSCYTPSFPSKAVYRKKSSTAKYYCFCRTRVTKAFDIISLLPNSFSLTVFCFGKCQVSEFSAGRSVESCDSRASFASVSLGSAVVIFLF